MNIPVDVLLEYGAVRKHFSHRETIFRENQVAFFYFQIESGLVKMVNHGPDSDFIQGIFSEGESFGEPPMIGQFPYPATATAILDTETLALPRADFIELLRTRFDIHLQFSIHMCQRVQNKARLLKTVNLGRPEERILAIIDLLKSKLPRTAYCQDGQFIVPITRQEIADMVGLRVETVIRKVGLLERQGHVQVIDRKILRAYN